ncbi:hypothetical protein ScPMuIL_017178 [Solemya velum]
MLKKKNSPVKKEVEVPKRVSIRDMLLIKEVQEMEEHLPKTCKVSFDDADRLHLFTLIICPEDGFWHGGRFKFNIDVPEEYNIIPPQVICLTRIWHPNITENGEVCLSLLRQNSIDSLGWAPTRKLKDVIWGLNSLFSDLLNFEDPLNVEAAEHYERDKEAFKAKVRDYIQLYAKSQELRAEVLIAFDQGRNFIYDLLNFEDPLNVEAAEHYERDKEAFKAKVRDYIQLYAKR